MRGQIFVLDLIFVAIYYIILVPVWYGYNGSQGLGSYIAQMLANTPWAWLTTVINVLTFLAPVFWLIAKAMWTQVVQ